MVNDAILHSGYAILGSRKAKRLARGLRARCRTLGDEMAVEITAHGFRCKLVTYSIETTKERSPMYRQLYYDLCDARDPTGGL